MAKRPRTSRTASKADRRVAAVQTAASLDVDLVAAGEHGQPFAVLGPHVVKARNGDGPAFAVRAFLPGAAAAAVRTGRRATPMQRLHRAGFFEAVFPAATPFDYTLDVTDGDGTTRRVVDPYALPPVLGDLDLHLFQEGTHHQLYGRLGAQVTTHAGHRGVAFSVWAPNAKRVSVIGSFNRWDERAHPMRLRGESGIWELFVPGVAPGELYKFHIRTRAQDANSVRADPFGFRMEQRPNTASVVWDLRRPYGWRDAAWMQSRGARQASHAPLSIYEVHLGSWRRKADGSWLTYRELARTLVPYVKRMGFTHLELMPVMEHPFDGSWGYQTVGYFAPTSRFGTPADFKFFVDAAHRAGVGVILDWVPAHFPRDGHGLAFFDGTHLYEYADPRKGQHQDWGTFIYDYGRKPVVEFLLSNALYWFDEYHADGMRVDAVASMLYLNYSRKAGEWEPNVHGGPENLEAVAFVRRFNELVHQHFPDVLTFAEESTSWPGVTRPVAAGGLGFDLKWNMGWMNDTLSYVREDPLARKYHQDQLTFSLMYAFSEKFLLPLSHDEVVHGKRSLLSKMPGDAWKKRATLRALLAYTYAHPGKKLLFMGAELGQQREWNHDRQLDWELLEDPEHAKLHAFVRRLNRVHAATPALHEVDFAAAGFEWIDCEDAARSVVSFVRRARQRDDHLVVVANWTPVPWEGYRIGVPSPGAYRVLLDSDAPEWGGSGAEARRRLRAAPVAAHGRAQSIVMTVPPLAVVYLLPAPSR
jgi:1,4-alpha-glucan branching enzyme